MTGLRRDFVAFSACLNSVEVEFRRTTNMHQTIPQISAKITTLNSHLTLKKKEKITLWKQHYSEVEQEIKRRMKWARDNEILQCDVKKFILE